MQQVGFTTRKHALKEGENEHPKEKNTQQKYIENNLKTTNPKISGGDGCDMPA